jgi:hypothetical protein
MAYSGREYDSGFSWRGARRGGYQGYDSGYQGRGGWGGESGWGGDSGWGRSGYDAGYRGYGYGSQGYEGPRKSRWEIENGDPFGDRGAHTPMRITRGRYGARYGQGYDTGYMRGNSRDYGRDYYSGNPMGYEPYRGNWDRMSEQTRRGRYDTGWF